MSILFVYQALRYVHGLAVLAAYMQVREICGHDDREPAGQMYH